jgi:hypothetical protein
MGSASTLGIDFTTSLKYNSQLFLEVLVHEFV